MKQPSKLLVVGSNPIARFFPSKTNGPKMARDAREFRAINAMGPVVTQEA